jgi:hypothetical protein
VLTFNNSVQVAPANFIAGAFGFKGREFFDAPEGAAEPPKVEF